MIETAAVFGCASDDLLEGMIVRARKRPLIVGPALSERVIQRAAHTTHREER